MTVNTGTSWDARIGFMNRAGQSMGVEKVLITGAAGFIGSHLAKAFKGRYCLALLDLETRGNDLIEVLDVTKKYAVKKAVQGFEPDVVIHLAGNKNLSYCENHPDEAFRVNTEATRFLADAAKDVGAKMVFISSDYVFDGERGNYRERDVPNPTTVYGKAKFESEKYIEHSCPRYTILRSSAVYGRGGGFFDWLVTSLRNGREVDVLTDTYFTPTYIGDLIWAFDRIISSDISDILHVAGPEAVSRYNMAVEIAKWLKSDLGLIKGASVRDLNLPIAKNSSLNCEETSKFLKRKFLPLRKGLERLFKKPKRGE
jgi:dTDP-4-dehydrorhamnose reductase